MDCNYFDNPTREDCADCAETSCDKKLKKKGGHMAKDETLNVRINSTEKAAFIKKCDSIDREYYELLREFVTAFNEGRLKIEPTDGQKQLNLELYNA